MRRCDNNARDMTDDPDLADPSLYINRELSWLAFNERVLVQAKFEAHPLLERVKFLAIAANNLDEFFMVRVATLARQRRSGLEIAAPDGLTSGQCLAIVRTKAESMLRDIAECWEGTLRRMLQAEEITILEPADYTPNITDFLQDYFSGCVCPVLTPMAFDPGHPFPYISNRSNSFAVVVESDGRTRFARVKVPDVLPRFVAVPPLFSGRRGLTFALLEDIIRLNLGQLFPGMDIVDAHLFRVIRETDIVLQEEEAVDLLESVDQGLRATRHGQLSLLQVDAGMPPRVLDILIENFEIGRDVVMRSSARLGFADWMSLTSVERPKLKDAPLVPRSVWQRQGAEGIFEQIRYRDTLLHHPFDSFTTFEAFLDAAVDDEQVVAIKMTLYRVGNKSPLVERLMAAAEAGKQIAVLLELKARFDERSNIGWASRLEEAGVHVVYGLVNLKTHCKLCLVIRKEAEAIQRYVHIGTGNYNRATAQVYTDFGLFTANPRIAADASELFNYLTGYSKQTNYLELIVAPVALRDRLTALIEREVEHQRAGRPAGIIIKNNAISDAGIIQVLYGASRAGVPIRAIVRGICCLRPGVAGVSETIQVRSIVGRYLEHSRVYYFENGGEPAVYLGSADLMERNLDRRVEALCPVLDPDIARFIRRTILDAYLADTERASVLCSDGTYRPPTAGQVPVDDQQLQVVSSR
ncbi:MAG: polyphosphate kinase 1 [Acidobacteria bacterium]|nr:MAG: polyphosphate kinase 1 [Acidobacteriota bacterium]